MLYESLLEFPLGRDSHDLLRQQSENQYFRSKNRPENDLHEKFHVFQDFSIFNDFRSVLASVSISWRDFLPGDDLGSPESGFPKFHPNSDFSSKMSP